MTYWCVFCKSGEEDNVAAAIRAIHPEATATAVKQLKRYTKQGKVEERTKVLFPGYVFIASDNPMECLTEPRIDNFYRLLLEADGEATLQGANREFAKWIFRGDGVIGFSKAMAENDRIRIVSGPLKELEGRILKIDRHNQNAQVQLEFGNTCVKAWLGYEMMEGLEDKMGARENKPREQGG